VVKQCKCVLDLLLMDGLHSIVPFFVRCRRVSSRDTLEGSGGLWAKYGLEVPLALRFYNEDTLQLLETLYNKNR
jgi:hypothetical protein